MLTLLEIALLLLALAMTWRFLGAYMADVYEGKTKWLGFVERPIYKLLGVDPNKEQSWKRYSVSLIAFSLVSLLFTYFILRVQNLLPLNPSHMKAVTPALAFNTAVSFVTNTNWQNYAGEQTMSYFSQMGALAVQQFVSASVGVAVAIALIRGFSGSGSSTIGNFWADLIRGILYILLPVSAVAAVIFVGQGAVQTLGGPVTIHNALNGVTQTIPRGPVASMEAIKQFGTNGGGFFNANGAIPFENPTPLTNVLSIYLLLSIPLSLTYTFGRMVGSVRQGIALLGVMVFFFLVWTGVTIVAEHGVSPALDAAGFHSQGAGNMVGKESRFGISSSVLYNIASTQTSTGSVNSSMDSYTPLGGMMALSGMMLGEVTPGGVGSGLYTILLFAIVTVFIAGLMVGRTPEYLGKKIQAKEMKLASLGVLIMPITVLTITGIAMLVPSATGAILNKGPHGFSEILYAFTSQGNNNGSAFAGLSSNNTFYNVAGAIAMWFGRFGVILPSLALAGALASKGVVPATSGTFRTDSALFGALLIGVILVVGALTFFPALALGPLAEEFSKGRLF